MVGGVVVGVAINKEEKTAHVSCVERCYPNDEPTSVRIRGKFYDVVRPGDSLWWQCGKVYWTPQENRGKKNLRCHVDYDIEMEKLGYSH